MAQAPRSSAAAQPAPSRVDVIAPAELGKTAIEALRVRGISARVVDQAPDDEDAVVAWALAAPPSAASAVELAARCARAAELGRPVCLLAPAVRGTNRAAIERIAALAHLRAYGAAILHDVDAWLEAIVLLVRFGLPPGPRTAVIAPEGSWLRAQATAIVVEAETLGTRSPLTSPDDPTDVALYDPALGPPPRNVPAMYVPITPRGELAGNEPTLYGARPALGAVTALGFAAERIAVGLGPAPRIASAELTIDHERLQRQRAKLRGVRIGDHETKVLLRAYNVPITKQVVAVTPSAAVQKARLVGFPVEIKPFGDHLPTEPEGCHVERDITSAALVRQAFTSVITRLGQREEDGAGVIIRAKPIAGREVSVMFLELPSLGWTVVLEAGSRIAAAPVPLRMIDANTLAAHVISSRADDPEPDRDGLADALRRTSHLVVDLDEIASLELPRVIVGGRGAITVVVDAFATLH